MIVQIKMIVQIRKVRNGKTQTGGNSERVCVVDVSMKQRNKKTQRGLARCPGPPPLDVVSPAGARPQTLTGNSSSMASSLRGRGCWARLMWLHQGLRLGTGSYCRPVPVRVICPRACFRGNGNRHWVRGRKVCRVHKNAELVPDSAGMRMYVRTTEQTVRFW